MCFGYIFFNQYLFMLLVSKMIFSILVRQEYNCWKAPSKAWHILRHKHILFVLYQQNFLKFLMHTKHLIYFLKLQSNWAFIIVRKQDLLWWNLMDHMINVHLKIFWTLTNWIVSQIFIPPQNAHKCDEKREAQVLERNTQNRHYLQKA